MLSNTNANRLVPNVMENRHAAAIIAESIEVIHAAREMYFKTLFKMDDSGI
jgi:hypothetical protein